MYTQNRVIGQTEIIQKMKALGYDANKTGVCFGITHMAIQAILIGQREKFEERLRLIRDEPDLKRKIDAIRKKVKEKIKISDKEQKYLDVLSFFDGIMLYHDPLKFSEWFSQNIIQVQSLKVSPFVQPSALADEGGIVEVYSGPGIYTKSELSSYLVQLSNILEELPCHDKIAVQISCSNHAMLLTYDSKKKQWNFLDPNQLLKEPVSTEEIASEIMKGFLEISITAFNAKIYTTENYEKRHNLKEDLKEKFEQLHQKEYLKKNLENYIKFLSMRLTKIVLKRKQIRT